MENKDLKGKKIKGFKFRGGYVSSMDRHIGEVGEITSADHTHCIIQFKDNWWYYPISEVRKRLEKKTFMQKLVSIFKK